MDAYEFDKYVTTLEEKVEWLIQTLLIDALNYPYDMSVRIIHPMWLIDELAKRWHKKENEPDTTVDEYKLTILLELGM